MQMTPYERIGGVYSETRLPDPRIASAIDRALGDVNSVVNIGAGTGSYEPANLEVVAVEPSQTMLDQRSATAAPALLGCAEELPLEDQSVDAALAVLTVHHWRNISRAWAEIRRVARARAVFVTWDPESRPFWLTRDYLPELHAVDAGRFPTLATFDSLGKTSVEVLDIPHDCSDGFMAAFWRRPQAYLDATVRANISTFDLLDAVVMERALDALERDLADGKWLSVNGALVTQPTLDAGYRIIVCDLV